jgi:hypothetical protein
VISEMPYQHSNSCHPFYSYSPSHLKSLCVTHILTKFDGFISVTTTVHSAVILYTKHPAFLYIELHFVMVSSNESQFKYFGSSVTNQNLIQEEIKRSLNYRNAFYHSLPKLVSSCLLSRNIHDHNFSCGSVWV